MPRHALATFFERLVLATLPLCACGGTKTATPPQTQHPAPADLAVATAIEDMGPRAGGLTDMAGRPADLATTRDLYGIVDPCDHNMDPPSVNVTLTAKDVPDSGYTPLCQSTVWCTQHCPNIYYSICCGPEHGDAGSIVLTCTPNCSGPGPGRRPAGLVRATIAGHCATGRWLAEAAHLEAASVHAFAILARELERHGAPRSLVAQARRARNDEARHARIMGRLARAHRTQPPSPRVTRARHRSIEAIAVENAAEGCVKETFAALLAVWQSRAAADPEVRAAMAAIAPDEIRHAELAWSVDAWARRRLDRAARARVEEARRGAVGELAGAVADAPPELVRALGLPDRERAATLVGAVERELWSRS